MRTPEFKKGRDTVLFGCLGALWNIFTIFFSGLVFTVAPGLVALVMFPVLALFFMVLPLPYIYLINKYGHKAGTVAIAITALLNLIVFQFMGLFYTLVTFGLVAIMVGGAFRERYKPWHTMLLSVAATVVSGLLIYYVNQRMGLTLEIRKIFEQSITLETMAKYEIDSAAKQRMVDYFLGVLPGMICAMSLVGGLINYYLAEFMLRKQGFAIERLQPVKEWEIPRWVALVFIVLGLVPADLFTTNLVIILFAVLTFEGIILCVFLFDRWGIYPWVRNLILIFGAPLLLFIWYIVGLVDNLFKMRGVRRRVEEDKLP